MTELLVRLDSATTGRDVDEVVIEYWVSGLNNKSSKNYIMKHFKESKETMKLKNFARFLAINDTHFESQREELITWLDKRFRFQIHTDALDFRNISFFCELVKFKLVPIYVLFHKIRSLVLNVSQPNNIDILSLMFEECGKLLQFDPEYAEPTKEMIALLREKRNDNNISREDRHSINIFLTALNPPSIKKLNSNIRELTMEEKFMDHLISTELNNETWKDIALLFKEMDWTNQVLVDRIKKIFVEPDQIRYDNVHNLALMFHHLFSSKFRRIRIEVVDELFERITVGLEDNEYKYNRIRLTQIKYLAELINMKIVRSDVVINLLYKIVCFGHENNSPSINEEHCQLDPSNDFFRVQLICDFLMTLNLSLVSKKVLSQLQVFYKFFDYYVFTKEQPLPFETNYKIHNLYLTIDENHERPANYKDAVAKLQEALREQGFAAAAKKEGGDEDEDEDEEDDDDEIEVDDDLLQKEIDEETGESSEHETDDEDLDDTSDDDDDSDDDSDDSDDSDSDDDSDDSDDDFEDAENGDDEEDEDAAEKETNDLFEKEVTERFNRAMEAEFAKLTTASIQYNMNNAATKQTRLENPTHILSRLQDGDTDLQQQQQQLEAGNDSETVEKPQQEN
ncbi:unnamed protein product [Ambrosiozyma monospora]|uniref:Unnamed protein product n=1 Tax=Ambrosiozyma monospora TaxID=43982 RepID=A0ACB5TBI5_AMBMO|nr:unnamed protein product [Ambrosiozyma monospora]